MVMDYDVIVAAVRALSTDGWRIQELIRADGYPVLVLSDPIADPGDVPTLLITAGIHGEEPAGVVGLTQWLTEHAASWVGKIRMHIIPCLNPWGYERGVRFGSHGLDLNREFDAPLHPVVGAFNAWLGVKRFQLHMDLHEDSDFTSMYLYELMDKPGVRAPTLGRRILQRCAKHVALSHNEEVGEHQTEHGIVWGPLGRNEAQTFSGRPIAIHVYAEAAPHVVTVETPGLLALPLRAKLHVEALQEACCYLTEMPNSGG